MKEVLYACEKEFLEFYLKEKAAATLDDIKAAADLWGNPIPTPGSNEAVNEIYFVEHDTAHIRIEGRLSLEGPDKWDRFWGYGGTSYITIQAAMERAKNDPGIKRVIFDMNSPGGTVAGCDETWQEHKALAAHKPTEVHAGSLLASAAYQIATPAHKILARSPSCRIGSIGVMVATYDWSKWEEKIGVKEIVITSSNAPDKHPDITTQKGRNTIKAQLDALERIMYARISEGRGVTVEHIAEHFGHGGLVVAVDPDLEKEDAVSAGMIDGILNGEYITGKVISGPKWTDEERKEAAAAYEQAIKPGAKFFDAGGKELPPEECEEIRQQLISMQITPLGENINPAVAGKTQEGHMKNLSELLEANPAAAAEVEKLKSEAKAAGAAEARAEYTAKVERAMPIITSTAYPANVKALACDVLAGKKGIDALDAAVTVLDANKEAKTSADAQAETEELGAVGAQAPDSTPVAEKEFNAAMQAELNRRKVK